MIHNIIVKTKILLLVCPLFVNTVGKVSGVKGLRAFTVVPGVVIVTDPSVAQDSVLMNHEEIHFAQAQELGLIRYVGVYVRELLRNRISHRLSPNNAYYSNPLEYEAYVNQSNMNYLQTRKPFAWKAYISSKEKKKILYVNHVLLQVNNVSDTTIFNLVGTTE